VGESRVTMARTENRRRHLNSASEKQFVRVDVSEEFPFQLTTMSPFYER